MRFGTVGATKPAAEPPARPGIRLAKCPVSATLRASHFRSRATVAGRLALRKALPFPVLAALACRLAWRKALPFCVLAALAVACVLSTAAHAARVAILSNAWSAQTAA